MDHIPGEDMPAVAHAAHAVYQELGRLTISRLRYGVAFQIFEGTRTSLDTGNPA